MDSLNEYFSLMEERPDLFRNIGERGEIKIILDRRRVIAEQSRIREKLRSEGKSEHWIDIGVLSEDQWFWVVRDLVEFPDGRVGGYIRFINRKSQEGGYNVVLMCARQNQVLMIKKFRHEERGWSWEFPRGFGEPGLTAEENARQELEEEVGLKPSRLIELTTVKEGDGGTSVFYAEIPEGQPFGLDKGEAISDGRWVAFKEFDQLIADGKVADYYTLWAYTLAKIKKAI